MLRGWRAYAADLLVAIGLAAAAVAALATASGGSERDPDATAYALALLLSLPLAARRQAPLAVLGVLLVGSLAYDSSGYPSVNVDFFGPVLALYTVAALRPRQVSVSAAVGLVLAFVVIRAVAESASEGSLLTVVVVAAGTWLLGDATRQRREASEVLEQQATALREARADLAEQAVTQERLRIARELHDVVAHHMSAASVQAAVALDQLDRDPAASRAAITSVQSLSRSALREMRQILGVLRERDEERGALAPAPGAGDLPGLCEQMRASGLDVSCEVNTPANLPAGVGLAVYRVVQEGLTNVLKHATAREARVRVSETADGIDVEVWNPGRGRSAGAAGAAGAAGGAAGGGLGLVGMRERVGLLGGSVEAGPSADGFRVLARIPLREDT